jgi:hypothetical protein
MMQQVPELKKFPLEVVGGSKFARYTQMTAESTVNMFVTGKDINNPALVPYFGYKSILDLESGEARGIFVSTRLGAMIVVMGRKVYRVSKFLTANEVGELDTASGDVNITDNINSQITIEDNNKIYVYDYANSSFSSPSVDFVPVFLDYQDTYTIATDNEGNWRLSESSDSTIWPPLDLRQLQTKADTLRAAVVLNRQLWIIGTVVSELWTDQGLQLFPYVRDNSVSIDYGAVSTSSIATGFKMLVWLGKNAKSQNVIVYTSGGPPVELSPGGLDYVLNAVCFPESSYGFLFQQDGHIFYQLTFNKDNLTVVYDFTSGEWHRATDEKRDFHIARDVVFFNGKTYFISFVDSKLYELSSDITTYDGEEIPRYRILPPIRFDDDAPFVLNDVTLQMEQGNNSGITKVGLSVAKNSGNSFGNVVEVEANSVGNRQGKMSWHGMGRAINCTMKFEFWSKGRFVITGGSMELYK